MSNEITIGSKVRLKAKGVRFQPYPILLLEWESNDHFPDNLFEEVFTIKEIWKEGGITFISIEEGPHQWMLDRVELVNKPKSRGGFAKFAREKL